MKLRKLIHFHGGVGDRGASIRVPTSFKQNDWTGYIEDRRPAANMDPYVVTCLIVGTTTRMLVPDDPRVQLAVPFGYHSEK